MEVINKENFGKVRFCDLKPGDCFRDDGKELIEMKIDANKEMTSLRMGYTLESVQKGDGLSIRLTDGAIYYYNTDDLVQPIKVKAVEE